MAPHGLAGSGSPRYFPSLAGLALLPLAPEIWLFFRNGEDLKLFAPIAYYEGIVSFLLLAPALFTNRLWSRIWVVAIGSAMAAAARDRKYQTLALYQSLIELTRLTHPLFDPRACLFSTNFEERKRRVGVAGRIYRKEQ
jgi:hypothetical protein